MNRKEIYETHDFIEIIDIHGLYIGCKRCKLLCFKMNKKDYTLISLSLGNLILETCNEYLIKSIIK